MRLPLRRGVTFAAKWMLQLKTEKEARQEAFSRPSWFENPGSRAVLGGLNRFTKKNVFTKYLFNVQLIGEPTTSSKYDQSSIKMGSTSPATKATKVNKIKIHIIT